MLRRGRGNTIRAPSQQWPKRFGDTAKSKSKGVFCNTVCVPVLQSIGAFAVQLRKIDCTPMLIHHSLGQLGGAGGINDIGQMPGREPQTCAIQVGVRLPLPFQSIGSRLAIRQLFARTPNIPVQMSLRQQRHRSAVLEHVPQPLHRIRRIQRHIRSTAFNTPNKPTTISKLRSTQIATRASGFTPSSRR